MNNEEMKEFIALNMKAIKAEIRAGNDISTNELKQINEHLKISNGRLAKVESKAAEMKNDIMLISWAKRNPIRALLFLIVIGYFVYSLYETYNIQDLIRIIKSVI